MTAEWVKVTDILQNTTDTLDWFLVSEPSEWLRMIREKSMDSQFATIIRLIETEGFTDPIGIVKNDGAWYLGNGHHRLAAAILMGLDKVLVEFGMEWPRNGDRYHEVQVQITPDDHENSMWISRMVSDAVIGRADELVTV